jgi:hypothetical protein
MLFGAPGSTLSPPVPSVFVLHILWGIILFNARSFASSNVPIDPFQGLESENQRYSNARANW